MGVDYHPSDQYIAFVDTETGKCGERRLNHSDGEAARFYRELAARGETRKFDGNPSFPEMRLTYWSGPRAFPFDG
jgi:hypothetical protein